jgi:ATP-binding cassette subfamily B protein
MRTDLSVPLVSLAKRSVAPRLAPPFLRGPRAFILHYVRTRPIEFAAVFLMVAGAASCAVGVQYVMKLLVDAMARPSEGHAAAWWALGVFIIVIAVESVLWRLSGWLGCRTTLGIGVDVRLDLFDYLNGQPCATSPRTSQDHWGNASRRPPAISAH